MLVYRRNAHFAHFFKVPYECPYDVMLLYTQYKISYTPLPKNTCIKLDGHILTVLTKLHYAPAQASKASAASSRGMLARRQLRAACFRKVRFGVEVGFMDCS